MSYPKRAKIYLDAPPDYDGPVFYRERFNQNAHYRYFPIADPADAARYRTLFGVEESPVARDVSPDALDEEGRLRAEWQIPLKATFPAAPEKCEAELLGSLSGSIFMLSERAKDLVESLEPDVHRFIPVDVSAPDGRVLRWFYGMKGPVFFRAEPPPAVHPDLNEMDVIRYTNGSIGFSKPKWYRAEKLPYIVDDTIHFGYLNETVVGGRHLFFTNLLDNSMVLSAELFHGLREMGDRMLDRRSFWVAMGSAHHKEPEGGYTVTPKKVPAPPRKSWWQRLFGG